MVEILILERDSEADRTECIAYKLHLFSAEGLVIASKN